MDTFTTAIMVLVAVVGIVALIDTLVMDVRQYRQDHHTAGLVLAVSIPAFLGAAGTVLAYALIA